MNGKTPDSVARRPRRLSRLLSLALILSILYFVFQAFAPQTLGETARRKLQNDLRHHYADYNVSIGRGHFDPRIGLTFNDIRITDPSLVTDQASANQSQTSGEVVRINRMTVLADVDAEKLLQQNIPLDTHAILLEGVSANAWLTESQEFSLATLWPLPKLGPEAPKMIVRQLQVKFFGSRDSQRPISAEIAEISIENKKRADGKTDRSVTVRGSTDFADHLLAKVDVQDDTIDLRCAINGIRIDRPLIDRMPMNIRAALQEVSDLHCECDTSFSATRTKQGKWNYQARTTVHDGRISHPQLPESLTQLRGVANCSPSGIEIEASQASLGDAILRVHGRLDGYQWPCDANLKVSARGLQIDEQLALTLPSETRSAWDRLQPNGRIDLDAELLHDTRGWNPKATVTCKGVDIRYERFPYPVESIVGQIEINSGIASADTLTGRVGDNRMQCAFQVPLKPNSGSPRSFVMATDGPIPIDQTLLSSLTPRGEPQSRLESFVRSLQPRGTVQLTSAAIEIDAEGNLSKRLDLRVTDGHLRYEKFAYPLYNVNGTILVDDDLVTLTGLRGNNANAGIIRCDGSYRMPGKSSNGSPGNPSELALQFHANDVPMDESLRTSLPTGSQQVWDSLAPSGILDELSVSLQQIGSQSPLQLDLSANQRDNPQITSRTLSLRPQSLPYRLDVTGGEVRFDGETVTIEQIRGRHDASTFSADGFCVENQTGRWELFLNLHSGCRLHPDAELIAALPLQMRAAMRALQLRGPVSVRGQTRVAMPDERNPEPTLQWDLALQLEGNRIADVGPVHSLRGEISIQGYRDETAIRANGEVRIDSMNVHDIQITGLRGPFSIEDDILFLGSLSRSLGGTETQNPPAAIRGNLFAGLIDIDGSVVLSTGNFDVDLSTYYAQLPVLLADFGHAEQDLTGTLSGQTHLQGNLAAMDLLRGTGTARVSGANVYQLPLIVQILNLLRLEASEDVAFTDGQVRFSLAGETVTFHDLQMWGDLVALQGGGTLNRRRELDLNFNTRVSPQNTFTQFIRPLGGTRYTLWTIKVRGPINSLQIERKALERVSETLEWLIPGMAENPLRTTR